MKCSGNVEVDDHAPILAFVEQKVACLGVVMPWSSGRAGRTQPRSFIPSSLSPLDAEYQPRRDAAECFSSECRW